MPHLLLTAESDKYIEANKQGVLKLILNLKSVKAPGPDQTTKEMLVLDAEGCAEILADISNY